MTSGFVKQTFECRILKTQIEMPKININASMRLRAVYHNSYFHNPDSQNSVVFINFQNSKPHNSGFLNCGTYVKMPEIENSFFYNSGFFNSF